MLSERITLPSGRVIDMNGIIKPGDIIETDDGWTTTHATEKVITFKIVLKK